MDYRTRTLSLLLLVPCVAFHVDPWPNQDNQINPDGQAEKAGLPGPYGDTYTDLTKRYSRQHRWWGGSSRFPWEKLPDRLCFRQKCEDDTDCCLRHSICHPTVKFCINCWYAQMCRGEEDCCYRYPYCDRQYSIDPHTKQKYVSGGRCTSELPQAKD